MHHRVKTCLPWQVDWSLWQHAETPSALAQSLRARLGALARAHEITLPNLHVEGVPAQNTTTLFRLVQTLMAPYQEDASQRGVVSGVDIDIGAGSLTSLSLLLHEFMTNAVKYGALSTDKGQITVESELTSGFLHLTWREIGGPPVSPPDVELGFGTRLETVLKANLGCQILREWRPEGVAIRAVFPVVEIDGAKTI
ncbi:HWE histidine kinase domain-containing protein [Ensifer sp. 1H6]|uniref:HWE histidine kinase domain-containing protein n=1 Tax=Ensifer sp. 1H6 TaxID=1911585 RepID=UPI001FDA2765|nr:HWE histidine kinase domain-containing protein [Ensifer sp. 1H6]